MKEEVKRLPIFQYIKSRKFSAILFNRRMNQYVILDLAPNLLFIKSVKRVKSVRQDLVKQTRYTLEALECCQEIDEDLCSTSYRYIRVLDNDDIDIKRWLSTESLEDLPVSTHPEITKEERIWAGEREGNWAEGFFRVFLTILTFLLIFFFGTQKVNPGFPIICFVIAILWLREFEWKSDKKADQIKISELIAYKEKLVRERKLSHELSKTIFLEKLNDYQKWIELTPSEFEYALKIFLENEGFELNVTRHSRDGGIDLKGKTDEGLPVLVQAKQYSSNVGVSVVREMIGIRELHPSKPLTIIISLVGFTKGAKELAEKSGIVLRTIKEEVFSI